MRALLGKGLLAGLAPVLAGAAPALALEPPRQDAAAQQGTFTLEVRVGSGERGWALIDRGSADGLALGDIVVFRPRDGRAYEGTVAELEERAARVELRDGALVAAAGTRGEVRIPRERAGAAPPARAKLRPAPKRQSGAAALPPPVFENTDDDWQTGEPLLARVRPLRPAERAPTLHGRSYAILDYRHATEDDRTDVFGRIGTGLVLENPFGRGDRVHFDAEWNARHVDVDDFDDEDDVELRVDRLSYAWGGDRFEWSGWEVGRFLQKGMVEFGVLDGVEWTTRTRGGDRFSASVGFLPEPDQEFQTGQDFQLAGSYRWVADESEQLSASAGYQKTFHDGAADRDLVVANLSRLPRSGWSFFSTLWVDLYTDGDDAKGTFAGLTQAYVSTGRRFDGGSALDLVYTHREFPEIDRDELPPVSEDQLADDHAERIALTSGVQLGRDLRLRTALGAWSDEDEDGVDAEIGFGVRDVIVSGGFADLGAFATRGEFTHSAGGRLSFGCFTRSGRWALDYEFMQSRLDGFSSANDDLPQHRLRFSRDHAWHGWNLSWHVEGQAYDDEHAVWLGLYLQRRHDSR